MHFESLTQEWQRAGWQVESHVDEPVRDREWTMEPASLVATRSGGQDKPSRVVFLASLEAPKDRSQTKLGPSTPEANEQEPPSDLVALSKLAGSMSRTLLARAEVLLVATHQAKHEQLWLTTLLQGAAGSLESKPTLVVDFACIGRGVVTIFSRQHRMRALATRAAIDLWLPHRTRHWGWGWHDLIPSSRYQRHEPWITLSGDCRPTQVNPAIVAAAIQLATEIALRWTRHPDEADPGANLPRSTQKPG